MLRKYKTHKTCEIRNSISLNFLVSVAIWILCRQATHGDSGKVNNCTLKKKIGSLLRLLV